MADNAALSPPGDDAAALWERHFRDPEAAFADAHALLDAAVDSPGTRAWCNVDDRVPPSVLHGAIRWKRSAGSTPRAKASRPSGDRRGVLLAEIGAARLAIIERSAIAARDRLLALYRGSAAGARTAGPVLAVERDRRRALLHRSDGRCDPLPVRSARDAAWRRALAAAPDHHVEPGGGARHGGRLCAGVRARRSSARRSRALRQSAARDVRAVQLRGSAERHRCARACAGGYRADARGRGERAAARRRRITTWPSRPRSSRGTGASTRRRAAPKPRARSTRIFRRIQ